MAVLVLTGGVGAGESSIQAIIAAVVGIGLFLTSNVMINKLTDKEYAVIMEEYKKKCDKLINQDPEQVENTVLSVPAEITLTRVKANEGKLGKLKYIVNGTEYALKNGETITFTTNKALNTIEAKSLTNPTTYYFTVADNDKLAIEYRLTFIHDVVRQNNI